MTVRVARLITEIVPLFAFATTAWFVSGLIETPRGKDPTPIVPIVALVVRSMTVTLFEPRLVTTAWFVFGLTAMLTGRVPTGIVPVTAFVFRSMTLTDEPSPF